MNKKDLLRKVLLVICACVFLFSAYQLATIFFDYQKIENESEELIEEFVDEPPVIDNNKVEETDEVLINPLERTIDFDGLLALNEDVVGWIYIPGTKIDEPLMKGETNDTYLHTNIKKKKSYAGQIFIDEGNKGDLLDTNTIIHGHNMKNGSRFHNLRKYMNKDFYDTHNTIYIYLPDGSINVYDVYAADIISAYSELYATHVDYSSYVKSAKKNANHKSDISDEANPMIMLSTCYDTDSDDRYVVFARLKENVKVD